MSKALRFSEIWYRRMLWLIALVFASFLIGLGGLVVGDLPRVDEAPTLERFLTQPDTERARAAMRQAQSELQTGEDAIARQELVAQAERGRAETARETLGNWLQTRAATARADQDDGQLRRTRELDAQKARERLA
ncbi:MAG: hypothetical protein VW625_10230 [Perlucidibaca sp.]